MYYRMLQTFTAEKTNDQGLGRRTFALERDLNPSSPSCHIFESQLTISEAHSMSGSDLWTSFARELMSCDRFRKDRDRCKWFAFMSFTRYSISPTAAPPSSHSEILSNTKGHTALGESQVLSELVETVMRRAVLEFLLDTAAQ
jgi:hypothetical protein